MKIHFLGVGGGVPSPRRALPAIAVYFNGKILLIDCGEGTQIQFQRAGLSLQRIREIFISHMHGDHILGLPGLLSSMALLRRTKPLGIFGPPGLQDFVQTVLELTHVQSEFDITLKEVKKGVISTQPKYTMECLPAIHSIPSVSFILRMSDLPGRFNAKKAAELGVPQGPLRKHLQQGKEVRTTKGLLIKPSDVMGSTRKGIVIAYSGDTAPNPNLVAAAKNVELLIHDATFINDHESNASMYSHSTAMQAAQLAAQAEVRQLALVHISPRYENTKQHEEEAKAIFPKVTIPQDLDIIELKSHI